MANVDDLGKDWKRRDKNRHTYDFEELPYQLDTQLLASEAPEVDRERGMGRVVQTLMEAAQGNFDHLSGQLRKNRDVNNEHAADTSYIKRELLPHEHSSDGINFKLRAGYGYGSTTAAGLFTSEDTLVTNQLNAMPFYVGTASAIDRIGLLGGSTAGTRQVRTGIYTANEEGFPSELIIDAGLVSHAGTQRWALATVDIQLAGSQWYWLCSSQQGAGTFASWYGVQNEFSDLTTNWMLGVNMDDTGDLGNIPQSGYAYQLAVPGAPWDGAFPQQFDDTDVHAIYNGFVPMVIVRGA